MVQGSKRKTFLEKEDKCWCNYKTVLDLTPGPLPEAPVKQYLDEVPLSLRGAPGDTGARAGAGGSLTGPVRCLQAVLGHACAQQACRALLWLAVGSVFGHWPQGFLLQFREGLGDDWFLITLATAEAAKRDRRTSDWVTAALPFVLAQAIYRMLCDGFSEDKKLYTTHADRLLGKLTQVVHFETTGFQMNLDTVRRERRRLLQKHVFKSPHINQREFLRGQRRQELLESQSISTGDQPLRFGDEDAQPLEDTQLDHLMQEVAESPSPLAARSVRSGKDSFGPGTPAAAAAVSSVPPELSVERYAHLSMEGAEMLARQLEEFAVISGDFDEEELPGDFASAPGTPILASRNGSHQPPTIVVPDGEMPVSRQPSLAPSDVGDLDAMLELQLLRPMSPQSKKLNVSGRTPTAWTSSRRGSMLAATKFTTMKAHSRERKLRAEKAKKMKQAFIVRKICDELLPDELCRRELTTTWVSPCQMNLMKGEDRNLLSKGSSQAHLLKMETRPRSMPALGKAGEGTTSPRAASAASRDGGYGGHRGGSVVHSRVNSMVGTSRANSTVGLEGHVGTALPRVHSAGMQGAKNNRVWATSREAITLEPPPRLSAKLVTRRLEEQAKASKQMSFALYMKEYDIFTDQLKRSVDGERLRDEEEACLRKSDQLLAGPPKRRLFPEDLMMRTVPRVQVA